MLPGSFLNHFIHRLDDSQRTNILFFGFDQMTLCVCEISGHLIRLPNPILQVSIGRINFQQGFQLFDRSRPLIDSQLLKAGFKLAQLNFRKTTLVLAFERRGISQIAHGAANHQWHISRQRRQSNTLKVVTKVLHYVGLPFLISRVLRKTVAVIKAGLDFAGQNFQIGTLGLDLERERPEKRVGP